MKQLLKTLFAATIAIVFSSSIQAADKVTLLLDWFINPDHGPVIIAQEKGYFSELGLEVERFESAKFVLAVKLLLLFEALAPVLLATIPLL